MYAYIQTTNKVECFPFRWQGRVITIPKPEKGIYEARDNSPKSFQPFTWKVENNVAIPELYAPSDWKELGFPIRIKAHDSLLSIPDFEGVEFAKIFSIWLQQLRLRGLPIQKNEDQFVVEIYLNKFTYPEEEENLRNFSAFGWKLSEGKLMVGYASEEGMTPIFGNIANGSLVEIQKIEELQPD